MINSRTFVAFLMISAFGFALLSGCFEDEEEGEGPTIMVAGEEIALDSLFSDFGTKTIVAGNGETYSGPSLSDIINATSLMDPAGFQYKISAEDGFAKNVTWDDMMRGILVEDQTMTAFPVLPGRYRIRDVEIIEAVTTQTITVNSILFTFEEPFDLLGDPITMTDGGGNFSEGVKLSDVVNLTGLFGPQSREYMIKASDGYEKNVTWGDMTNGILVLHEYKTFFPHLPKQYWIKDVIEIEVI